MESLSTVGSYLLGFREVLPNQISGEKWKEILINVGTSQSTLRDIKVPERSGGYCYKDQTNVYTRNRFIYWRLCHDVLELADNSLDFNLMGNNIRYKFQNTPVLEGVSIHETKSHVVILVATVSSVHRFSFPHPYKQYNPNYFSKHHPDLGIKSIFHDATVAAAKDPSTFYVLNHTATNTPLPHCAISTITLDNSALFALAYNTGTVLLVNMQKSGEVELKETKEGSMIPRFLIGFAGILRGKSTFEIAVSMVLHSFERECYLFTLHRDGVLRTWSTKLSNCLAEEDITAGKLINGVRPTEGVQPHILKKYIDPSDSKFCLGVYLNFSEYSQVCLIQVDIKDTSVILKPLFKIDALSHDLIDLSFGPQRVWALWRTAEGTAIVSSIILNYLDRGWQFSLLEKLPDLETVVSNGMDIAEECLNFIFHPGRFPLSIISKAVAIFRRSTITPSLMLSASRLRQMVILAVEAEIEKDPLNKDLNDIDKLDVMYQTWLQFYSCCVQFYDAHTRPIGLLPLQNLGVVLIKKQEFSLLRPMETLEYMLLVGSEFISEQSFHLLPPERKSSDVMEDLMHLMSVLIDLDNALPVDLKELFMEEMHQQKSPDKIAKDMLYELTAERKVYDHDFLSNLGLKLNNIKNLYSTLVLLIDTLSLKQCSLRGEEFENMKESPVEFENSMKFVYSSNLAIPVLAMSMQQFTSVRCTICRSLLLLQQLLLGFHKKLLFKIVDPQYANVLHSSLVPNVVLAMQSYFVLLWACSTTVTLGSPTANVETYPGKERSRSVTNRASIYHKTTTIAEAYLQQWNNTYSARTWLSYWGIQDFTMWPNSMLAYITLLCQQMWPVCNNFDLPNFFLMVDQCGLVLQYMRLLNSWCEWYSSSRKYLHGLALLKLGQHHKALDCFIEASKGRDAIFCELVKLGNIPQESFQVHYYLKLIQLFVVEKHWNCVITLAKLALAEATSNEDICTLQSIIFMQHMRLGHYREAFHILPYIPIPIRRRNCMHQAIVTLTERNHFNYLLEFPCHQMFSEFESLLLTRARTMDLQDSPYYNFMYSFYMKTGNTWSAAKIMFEQGFRLGHEGGGSMETIEKQAHCYLAAINLLSLIDPDIAWVVKPVLSQRKEKKVSAYEPRKVLSEEEVLQYQEVPQVEQLTVDDVRKEYKLVIAKLRLMKFNRKAYENMADGLGVQDFIAVLTSVGMYELALELCDIFNESMKIVFDALTMSCIKLTLLKPSKSEHLEQVWQWLQENSVSELGVVEPDAVKLSWGLLQTLCNKYERPKETILYKVIAERLVIMQMHLPHWLEAYYYCNNPSELLRIFLHAGKLKYAANIAQKYILAALGQEPEKFGMKHTLDNAPLPTYVPVHLVDLLLEEMEAKPQYKKITPSLKALKEKYVKAVTSSNIKTLQYTVR